MEFLITGIPPTDGITRSIEKMKRDKIKETLLRLLEKYPADDLSVKTVCSEACISKQTLYNNFYGILGAIEEIVGDLMEEATADYTDNHDWLDGLRAILEMIANRRNVFIHLYYSKYRDDMLKAIYMVLGPIVANGVQDCAARSDSELTEYSEKVVVGFYMDICMGVVGRFIHKKMTDNPVYVAEMYRMMLLDHDTKKVLKDVSELDRRWH